MKLKPGKYTIAYHTDEGSSAQFYRIVESRTLGFKEYGSKQRANYAYKIQKQLSSFGLAPKVYGKICKLKIKNWDELSGWGYITQKVRCNQRLSRKKIQDLVDKIYAKTGLKFWDCHDYNIGVYRDRYLCIDTGKESFDIDCNAWGMCDPGPRCSDCNKFNCKCEWGY